MDRWTAVLFGHQLESEFAQYGHALNGNEKRPYCWDGTYWKVLTHLLNKRYVVDWKKYSASSASSPMNNDEWCLDRLEAIDTVLM